MNTSDNSVRILVYLCQLSYECLQWIYSWHEILDSLLLFMIYICQGPVQNVHFALTLWYITKITPTF